MPVGWFLDVFRFALTRRLRAARDLVLGIVVDGAVQPTLTPEVADAAVT